MSIRDENFVWKNDAVEQQEELILFLHEKLTYMLSLGFTIEDFYYLASTAAEEVILGHLLRKKREQSSTNGEKL